MLELYSRMYACHIQFKFFQAAYQGISYTSYAQATFSCADRPGMDDANSYSIAHGVIVDVSGDVQDLC